MHFANNAFESIRAAANAAGRPRSLGPQMAEISLGHQEVSEPHVANLLKDSRVALTLKRPHESLFQSVCAVLTFAKFSFSLNSYGWRRALGVQKAELSRRSFRGHQVGSRTSICKRHRSRKRKALDKLVEAILPAQMRVRTTVEAEARAVAP